MSSPTKKYKEIWKELGLSRPEIQQHCRQWENDTEEIFSDIQKIGKVSPNPESTVEAKYGWEEALTELMNSIPKLAPIVKSQTIHVTQPWEYGVETLFEEYKFDPAGILDFENAPEKMSEWEFLLKVFWEEYMQFCEELPIIPKSYRALMRIRAREREDADTEWWEDRLYDLLYEIAEFQFQTPKKAKIPPLRTKEWESRLERLLSEIPKAITSQRQDRSGEMMPWEKFLWDNWCRWQQTMKLVPKSKKKSHQAKWEKELKKLFAIPYSFKLPTAKDIWLPPKAMVVPNPMPEEKKDFLKCFQYGDDYFSPAKDLKRRRHGHNLWPLRRCRKMNNKVHQAENKAGKGWMHVKTMKHEEEKEEICDVSIDRFGRKRRGARQIIHYYNYGELERIPAKASAIEHWFDRQERYEKKYGLKVDNILRKPDYMTAEDYLWQMENSSEFIKLLNDSCQYPHSLPAFGNRDLKAKSWDHNFVYRPRKKKEVIKKEKSQWEDENKCRKSGKKSKKIRKERSSGSSGS